MEAEKGWFMFHWSLATALDPDHHHCLPLKKKYCIKLDCKPLIYGIQNLVFAIATIKA